MERQRTILSLNTEEKIIVDAIEGKETLLSNLYPELKINERVVSEEFYQEIVENGGIMKY